MKRTAIIVAGGTGTRMGHELPKQFIHLADKPIIIHTVEKFLRYDAQLVMVVVLHASTQAFWQTAKEEFLSPTDQQRVFACVGGSSRTESVANGLSRLRQAITEREDSLVAIHDAVRPFVSFAMLDDAYSLASSHGAAVCCVPVKSSIREQTETGSQAVDRSRFFHVQTPQTFVLNSLYQAYQTRPHDSFTDDASLYEAAGGKVEICKGSYDNIKLTTPEDLFVAESILKKEQG